MSRDYRAVNTHPPPTEVPHIAHLPWLLPCSTPSNRHAELLLILTRNPELRRQKPRQPLRR